MSHRDRRPSSGDSVTMNMTPLIDVVFLLIIFFLVSSHLAQQESQPDLELPQAATGDADAESTNQRLTINLRADGAIVLAGKQTSVDELQTTLAYEREHSERPLEVRLRADRGVPYGQVEPVLVACARSGVWDVRLAVREEGL